MKVKELRSLAKDNGLRGYSRLRKSELIRFLRNYNIPIPRVSLKTNETFGMSIEKFLCDEYHLPYNNYFNNRIEPISQQLQISIRNTCSSLYMQSFQGLRNESVDFILRDGKTLSVKTNFNSFKVCPQTIGQTTKHKFSTYFHVKTVNTYDIKKYIIRNIYTLLKEYVRHLCCCDYLLWVYKYKQEWHTRLFNKNFMDKLSFIHYTISFTKTIDDWNESTTIKADGLSIGEFQIHTHRNCIKFRFHLLNLLKSI